MEVKTKTVVKRVIELGCDLSIYHSSNNQSQVSVDIYDHKRSLGCQNHLFEITDLVAVYHGLKVLGLVEESKDDNR